MDLTKWLPLIGIPSVISGLVVLFIQRGMKARDRSQEEIRKKSLEMEIQNRAIMMGLQAILRDMLLKGYRHYFRKGWADYDDRESLENLWTQYHALGANGIMNGYRARFLALPVFREAGMDPEEDLEKDSYSDLNPEPESDRDMSTGKYRPLTEP